MPERRESFENIQQVVRAMVVSLAHPDEIYNSYLKQDEDISVLRYYVGLKGEEEKRRLTLFGGKIKKEENWKEAIQREVYEEVGLTSLGIPKQTEIGQWSYSSPNSGNREVILTYSPVSPCGQIAIGDSKITQVKTLSHEQFINLIKNGHLDGIPLEGHLAIGESSLDKIEINESNLKDKDVAMERAMGWGGHIEEHLKKKFKTILTTGITKEDFELEYQKILSEFMRRGLEVGLKKKLGKEEEIKTEIESNTQMKHDLVEVLNDGYLGNDILYYLPEFAKHGQDWAGLENATDGTKVFMNFLNQVFNESMKEQELTVLQYENELKDPGVLLTKKNIMINNLNKAVVKKIKDSFGINDGDLNEALGFAQDFIMNLSNDLKVADPKLTGGLYQDFALIDEINEASIGKLISLFFGYDTKQNLEKVNQQIRFEAGRQLLLLFKSLSGLKHYHESINNLREGKLKLATSTFFGTFKEKMKVDLGENNYMQVDIRDLNGENLIYDRKYIKSFFSFLRKSFAENIEDIADFYTVAVAFVDDNEGNVQKPNKIINNFIDYLKKNYPNSVVETKDTKTYGTESYVRNKGNVALEGKRKGSLGSLFVRTKVLISLDEEVLELIIYPFYSLKDIDNEFWGWLETMRDNKNYVVRRMLAGNNGIPSMHDLLLPPELYPRNFGHKLLSEFHQ